MTASFSIPRTGNIWLREIALAKHIEPLLQERSDLRTGSRPLRTKSGFPRKLRVVAGVSTDNGRECSGWGHQHHMSATGIWGLSKCITTASDAVAATVSGTSPAGSTVMPLTATPNRSPTF